MLAENGVTVMLAGGIGGGAISVLNSQGVEVFRGCEGDAKETVKLYVEDLVKDSVSGCHKHDEHEVNNQSSRN